MDLGGASIRGVNPPDSIQYLYYIYLSGHSITVTSAINQILTGIMPLEQRHIELFISKFRQVSYFKGDHFIREGQVSRYLGFIKKAKEYQG